MSPVAVGAVLLGVVLLVVGAELLVKGAAAVASRLGVQPVVIGLTVVAFGTSAPELAVSVSSALSGEADLAFGNVVGSNIVNAFLILGASAVIGTLVVSQRIVRIDAPLVVLVSLVAFVMVIDRRVGRFDGIVLVAGAVLYTGWLVRTSRRETRAVTSEYEEAVDELEGALTERPLAVGNVVGSNLFNLLFVLGASAVVAPDGVVVRDQALRLDLPVMLLSAVLLVPIVWNGFRITRWEGLVLMAAYVAYSAYLVLDAADHRAAPPIGIAALVVAPLAVMAFGVTGYQGWRRHRVS